VIFEKHYKDICVSTQLLKTKNPNYPGQEYVRIKVESKNWVDVDDLNRCAP
jgi:hypothetical protein